MGRFDGLLLCTDLDDTILTSEKTISEKTIKAVRYFMSEGGLFTFATGRVPKGVEPILKYVVPNAPMVCFNGGCIYDIQSKRELWAAELTEDAKRVVDYTVSRLPFTGVEVCTKDRIYFCIRNRIVDEHQRLENFPDNDMDYHDIPHRWRKVLFMVEKDEVELVRSLIAESEFADTFSYVKSSPWYYEILPKNSTKGEGLIRLAKLLGIKPENTIGVGDNENDLDLVKKAGTGVAVANAAQLIKAEAQIITTADNNHDAVAELIYSLGHL